MGLSYGIPHIGQMVIVRGRPGVAEEVNEYNGAEEVLHSVEVRYIDGWNYPERDIVIWQREFEAQVQLGTLFPRIADTSPDSKEVFENFINAYRWSAINKIHINETEDTINLIAPWQSAIQVEDYQLYPLLKALLMPRIALLLADDVGLGKTIEAGLIISELVARGRLKRAMIICPASLQLQWKEELKEKFSLDFEIIDRKKTLELQKELGINMNPWMAYPRVITSMDYIRQADVHEKFKSACDKLRVNEAKLPWNMLIVDEAHNFNPTVFGDNSQRYNMLKEIGTMFEHKIFLTATPHNGYTHAFTGLLELLDPVRFSQIDSIDDGYKKHIDNIMIRRLKKDLNTKSKKRFAQRIVKSLEINLSILERKLNDTLRSYRKEGIEKLNKVGKREAQIGQFLFNLLTKRLLSDPYAFAYTWWNKIVIESTEEASIDEVAYAYKRAEDLVEDDAEKERRENELLFKSSKWLNTLGVDLEHYIEEINEILNEMGFTRKLVTMPLEENKNIPITSKMKQLVEVIAEKLEVKGEYIKDERIIIFTEYKQTLNYLQEILKRKGYQAPYLDVLYGGMNTNTRQVLKERFNAEESNLKILLATDAASEGINLQNGCRYVVHYDIPWNPMRMEQRNGRVDRHGQRRDVNIIHFTSCEDNDMTFLGKIASKIEHVREDLGSVSQVIDGMIQGHFSNVNRGIVNTQEDVDLLKLKTTLKTNVREIDNIKAYQRLRATELQLGLCQANLFNFLSDAIRSDGGVLEEVEEGVYRISKVPANWRMLLRDTLEVKKGSMSGLPKITFNPNYFKKVVGEREFYINKADTVLIRLAHPIMQKAVAEIKKELWLGNRINRWTILESKLPVGIDAILKFYMFVEVVNKLGEKIHQEVMIHYYQIFDEQLVPLDIELERELRNCATKMLEKIDSYTDKIEEMEEIIEDNIKIRFKEAKKAKIDQLEQTLQDKLASELVLQSQLYDERIEMLKNDKLQRKLDKITNKLKQEIDNLIGPQQMSFFEDSEVKTKERIRRLEKEKEIISHNIGVTRELLKEERKRVLKEVLPKKYTVSNMQVYPLGMEIILASKGDQ